MIMLPHIDKLNDYKYYFQFTLTGYGKDIEAGLPEKNKLIDAFRTLSYKNNRHIVWRYDPIIFTKEYTIEWHLNMFEAIAKALAGFTDRCVISFVDVYDFVGKSLSKGNIYPTRINTVNLTPAAAYENANIYIDFCKRIVEIAQQYGMNVFSCAEVADFKSKGIDIQHGSCIDKDMIESIIGYPLKVKKDASQRDACKCVESVDFGKYSTCANGCKYCYACKNPADIKRNLALYDVNSPILCDTIMSIDTISERRLKSLRTELPIEQLSLF